VVDEQARARIAQSLKRMVSSMASPMARAELFAMNALEEALLWMESTMPERNDRQLDARILSAMDYLCSRVADTVALDDIGAHCGLSSSRLSHLFREQVGVTPIQYVEQQRIRKARELLEISAFTVSEIAYQTGYESPFYFSRRFSKAVGMSPKQYRRVNGRR
jgi:AraC family transcriptional regulator of arabinose operon